MSENIRRREGFYSMKKSIYAVSLLAGSLLFTGCTSNSQSSNTNEENGKVVDQKQEETKTAAKVPVKGQITMDDVNQMEQSVFVESIGWIFEHSPWIAEKAYEKRPFASLDELHSQMQKIVESASEEEKLNLLRAHPDLGARVKMAEASVSEQKGAGLDQLNKQEYKEFLALNKEYTEKFGFPFIIAVKGHNKDSIREAIKERIKNTREQEMNEALQQVYKISKFRLEDTIKK